MALPEPESLLMLAVGVVGLAVRRRKSLPTLAVVLAAPALIGGPNAAAAVTYVDASPENSVVEGNWALRTFANEGTVYQGGQAEDLPAIETTFTLPGPGVYAIYGFTGPTSRGALASGTHSSNSLTGRS